MSDQTGSAPERAASPFRLNLEQQRKRAKDLLRAVQAGDDAAPRRIAAHHPRAQSLDRETLKLSDCQLVIARELGLPSWPKLKAHILAMDRSWAGIRNDIAPDADRSTLHIRCGHDIGPTLREAGFTCDFLSYSDPLCHGPVVNSDDWIGIRADFLAQTYGDMVGKTHTDILADLTEAERRLQSAAKDYERVVLWFEHDVYDQLILARCLAQFAKTPPGRLELVSAERFPGSTRFIGLGQLPPEALRLLWQERSVVSETQLRAGAVVFERLREPDPRPLASMAMAGIPDLPQLATALKRHCQELPGIKDGLSFTERMILQIVAEQPRAVAHVFQELMLRREPLPYLTDLMMHVIVENMKAVSNPVFRTEFMGDDRHWPKEVLTVTETGRAVLAGETDWMSLQPPARWLGGVHITGAPCWCWNDVTGVAVKR